MLIKQVPVADLKEYGQNSRTHSTLQVGQIAESIKAFGWTNPLLVDEARVLIAGHGRLAAAKLLGLAEVPCIEIAGLSEDKRRALVIADNKLALNAGWDDAALASEIALLNSAGFDMDLLGFTAAEMNKLQDFDFGGKSDPDDAPKGTLSDRFMIPPFSVLNARGGWWQDRKRAWLALGIKSELGRGGGAGTPPHPPTVTQNKDGTLNYSGTQGQAGRFDRQRQAAAPGQRATTAKSSAATARGGR